MEDVNKKSSFNKGLGDKIERLGEKISSIGGTKIGKKIYDAGNKLEHKDDKVIKGSDTPKPI